VRDSAVPNAGAAIELRQFKCLNNVVEQNDLGLKKEANAADDAMMGFKSFRAAARSFLRPTTSTDWPPRRFLDGTALARPAFLIATEPSRITMLPTES